MVFPKCMNAEFTAEMDGEPLFPRKFSSTIARNLASLGEQGIAAYSYESAPSGLNAPEAEKFPPLGHPALQHALQLIFSQIMKTTLEKELDETKSLSVFELDIHNDPKLRDHLEGLGAKTDYTDSTNVVIKGKVLNFTTKSTPQCIETLRYIHSCVPRYTEKNSLLCIGDQEVYWRWSDGLGQAQNADLYDKTFLWPGRWHCNLQCSDMVARMHGLNVAASFSKFLSVARQDVNKVSYYRTGSGQQFYAWATWTIALYREYLDKTGVDDDAGIRALLDDNVEISCENRIIEVLKVGPFVAYLRSEAETRPPIRDALPFLLTTGPMMMAAHVAIRSGWLSLHNAVIEAFGSPMGSAGKNNYEKLSLQAKATNMSVSDNIRHHVMQALEAVSLTGNLHRNIAQDEMHEMIASASVQTKQSQNFEYKKAEENRLLATVRSEVTDEFCIFNGVDRDLYRDNLHRPVVQSAYVEKLLKNFEEVAPAFSSTEEVTLSGLTISPVAKLGNLLTDWNNGLKQALDRVNEEVHKFQKPTSRKAANERLSAAIDTVDAAREHLLAATNALTKARDSFEWYTFKHSICKLGECTCSGQCDDSGKCWLDPDGMKALKPIPTYQTPYRYWVACSNTETDTTGNVTMIGTCKGPGWLHCACVRHAKSFKPKGTWLCPFCVESNR